MCLANGQMTPLKNSRRCWPPGISQYYTDDGGAYSRHLDSDKHEIGKPNTQKIERKNLNLRTEIKRLTRKTIFSLTPSCLVRLG
jgi:IS1 family transposase